MNSHILIKRMIHALKFHLVMKTIVEDMDKLLDKYVFKFDEEPHLTFPASYVTIDFEIPNEEEG